MSKFRIYARVQVPIEIIVDVASAEEAEQKAYDAPFEDFDDYEPDMGSLGICEVECIGSPLEKLADCAE